MFFVAINFMKLNSLKICGITSNETARFCAQQGVGALGVVFFPKSPRNVTALQAAEVFDSLPESIAKVGVFVNMPIEMLLETAHTAGLTTVQMHGDESIEDIEFALNAGYRVIKVLKSTGKQLIKEASLLPTKTGIMIELSVGNLPGGNGVVWDWRTAAPLAELRDFALAGGLAATNLIQAAGESNATAFDLSSAVESKPGIKDHRKISALVKVANNLNNDMVFWSQSQ